MESKYICHTAHEFRRLALFADLVEAGLRLSVRFILLRGPSLPNVIKQDTRNNCFADESEEDRKMSQDTSP